MNSHKMKRLWVAALVVAVVSGVGFYVYAQQGQQQTESRQEGQGTDR